MTHTITISNQKGGVGKTTLTRELGIYLANTNRRVLLIDADPQGNLTRSLHDGDAAGLYEAIRDGCFELLEAHPGLSLLGADIRLAGLEKTLIAEIDAYQRLRELLQHDSFRDYDYILIDTPPSLGVLTVNALTAAGYILAPLNPAIYSLQGTNDLLNTISKVRKNLNPNLAFLGVIINAYDAHPLITRQIRAEIEQSFGEKVFRTALSRSVRVEEALAARRGLTAGESKVGDEIKLIGEELIYRIEGIHRVAEEA